MYLGQAVFVLQKLARGGGGVLNRVVRRTMRRFTHECLPPEYEKVFVAALALRLKMMSFKQGRSGVQTAKFFMRW
jgi:hypothetical protein